MPDKLAINATYITDTHKDAFWRVSVTDDGITQTKVLSQEQFANTLRKGTIVRKERKAFSLGKMPFGYVDAFISSEGTYTVAVLYPKKKRGVLYYEDTYYVPYPNVLYIYSVKNGILQSKKCFAVKDADLQKGISKGTPLYAFPFGNVSQEGSMCYGSIKYPDLRRLSSIDELVALFLNGQVNDDLYSAKRCSTQHCKQFELYRYLETKKTFPDKILCLAQGINKALTFGDVFYSSN